MKHVSCALHVDIDDICQSTQPCCVLDFDCSEETSEQSDAKQLRDSDHIPSRAMPTMSYTWPSAVFGTSHPEVDRNLSCLSEMSGSHIMPETGVVGSSTYLRDGYVERQLPSLSVQVSGAIN